LQAKRHLEFLNRGVCVSLAPTPKTARQAQPSHPALAAALFFSAYFAGARRLSSSNQFWMRIKRVTYTRLLDNTLAVHYYCHLIVSFRDKETERIWNGIYSKRFPPEIQRAAKRKLLMLHAAINLVDLQVPPGNRLHALSGDRKGQYSISINDQWRICFAWKDGNAYSVEITDYLF